MIHGHQGGHGFDDGHGAREHARVVATLGAELGGLAVGADRLLRLEHGGGGLESDTEDNVFAVGDAALRAAGAVGCGADAAALADELIVMRAAAEDSAGEAAANFEALGCRQREHGLGEVSFETIKDR